MCACYIICIGVLVLRTIAIIRILAIKLLQQTYTVTMLSAIYYAVHRSKPLNSKCLQA